MLGPVRIAVLLGEPRLDRFELGLRRRESDAVSKIGGAIAEATQLASKQIQAREGGENDGCRQRWVQNVAVARGPAHDPKQIQGRSPDDHRLEPEAPLGQKASKASIVVRGSMGII